MDENEAILTKVKSNSVGDKVYNAKWEVNNTEIEYNCGTGDVNSSADVSELTTSVNYDEEFTFKNVAQLCEKTGYHPKSFEPKSWICDNGVSVSVDDGVIWKHDVRHVTCTAQWEPNETVITYDCNTGGQLVSELPNGVTPKTNGTSATKIATYDSTFTFDNVANVCGKSYYHPRSAKSWNCTNGVNVQLNEFTWNYVVDDVTCTAQWEPVEYTIKYMLNGGTIDGQQSEDFKTETYNIESPEIDLTDNNHLPTRTDYVFDGWYNDADIENASEVTSVPTGSTENKTFYAKWRPIVYYYCDYDEEYTMGEPTYAGNYDVNSTDAAKTVTVGIQTDGTTHVQCHGKDVQWDCDNTGSFVTKNHGDTFTIEYPTTCFARYNITYNKNGGEYADGYSPTTTYAVNADVDIVLPLSPSQIARVGYTFGNWWDSDTNYRTTHIYKQSTSGDKVYNAKWNIIKYYINYKLNNGEITDRYKDYLETITTYQGEAPHQNDDTYIIPYTYESDDIALPIVNANQIDVARDDYVFGGWYTDAGIVTPATETEIEHNSTGNKTFYAKWKPEIKYYCSYTQETPTYTGNYDVNSGTVAKTVTVGVTTDGNNITCHNKRVDWDCDNTGSFETRNHGSTFEIENPTTCFARYKITYHENTGNSEYDAKITDDYINNKYSGVYDSARIDVDTVGITYPVNGGRTIAFPDASEIARHGHTFMGWYDNADFDGDVITNIVPTSENGDGDKEYWAKWQIDDHTITYVLNGGTINNDYIEKYNAVSGDDNVVMHYNVDSDDIYLPVVNDNTFEITRENYVFDGWFRVYNDNGINDEGFDEFETVVEHGSNEDLVFYAKWRPIVYYYCNHETPKYDTSYDKYETVVVGEIDGDTIDCQGEGGTNVTWDCRDWELGDITRATNPSQFNIVNATQCYARYKIEYQENGGTIASPYAVSYTVNPRVALPRLPGDNKITRTGYTFMGWYNNEEFDGDVFTQIPDGSVGDKMYYAKWKKNPYHIIYDCSGGVGGYSQEIYFDDVVHLIDNETESGDFVCTKDEHKFDKWQCDVINDGDIYKIPGNTNCHAQYIRVSCGEGQFLTPDRQCSDFCAVGDDSCPACGPGYVAKDNPVEDFLNTTPSEYAYTSNDGSMKRVFNGESALPKGTWGAKFYYGTITGNAVCDYRYPRECRCQASGFTLFGKGVSVSVDAPVVYLGTFNGMSCERDCAIMCSDKLRAGDATEFRRGLIGPLFPEGRFCLPEKRKITYNHGTAGERTDGFNGIMEYTTAFFNDNVVLEENAYSIAGYDFAGWSCKIPEKKVPVIYQPGDMIEHYVYLENTECTAVWTPKKYNLIFRPGRFGTGTPNMIENAVTYDGEPFDVNAIDMETAGFTASEGYGFVGWATDRYASDTISVYGPHRTTGDVTLYAIYKKIPSCALGQYVNDAFECEPCAKGTYTNTTGATQCETCPAGTFNDTTGASECTSCPENTYSEDGATQCVSCNVMTNGEYPFATPNSKSADACFATVECPDVVPESDCPENAICEYDTDRMRFGKRYFNGDTEPAQCEIKVVGCKSPYSFVNGVCVDTNAYSIKYYCMNSSDVDTQQTISYGDTVNLRYDICPMADKVLTSWICGNGIVQGGIYNVNGDTQCYKPQYVTTICDADEYFDTNTNTCAACDALPTIQNGSCARESATGCEYTCSCESGYELDATNNQCEPVIYTIAYETNGGVFEDIPPVAYSVDDDIITLPGVDDITKSDNRFVGWYDNAEFNGEAITEIDPSSKETKTLYAKWEFACTSNKWLHIGDEDKLCLTTTKPSTKPAVALLIDGEKYYVQLTNNRKLPIHDGAQVKWRIRIGNKVYNAHDLTVVPAN